MLSAKLTRRMIGFVYYLTFDHECERGIKPLRINSGDGNGQEGYKEEACPQGIHSIRHQATESTFESQNPGLEIGEDDEEIRGIVEAEGTSARYWSRPSTLVRYQTLR